MTASSEPALRPATWADWCSDIELLQRVGGRHGELVAIVRGHARHCPGNICGESYLCTWGWKGLDVGGSQGHLPVAAYRDANHFRLERGTEPALWARA